MLKFLRTFVLLMNRAVTINRLLKRKLATVLLVSASVAAFATLGDGSKKSKTTANVLSFKSNSYNYKTFSLKSGYHFRGNSFLTADAKAHFVMLNTTMKYQKGNVTYILPMKKKLFLGKVTFTPTAPQR